MVDEGWWCSWRVGVRDGVEVVEVVGEMGQETGDGWDGSAVKMWL